MYGNFLKLSFVVSDLDLAGLPTDTDTASDLMLAQMLQMEFDKEFDTQLRREEKKFNGESKGNNLSSQRPTCFSCHTYSVKTYDECVGVLVSLIL